jgi:hypothetical protein
MSNVSEINAAIAAAKAAAEQAPLPGSTQMVAANNNAPTIVTPGRPVKLGELIASAGMQVDAFLKVDKAGFLIGKDTNTFFDEVAVEFKLNSIKPFYGCRYGDPAKYLKSNDRITDARTKRSWAEAVAEAQRLDPRCTGDYPSADIPLTALVELKNKKGDAVLIKVGQTLGLTLSITNFAGFASFIGPYENLRDQGLMPDDVLLRGRLVHEQRTKGTNTWGLATFVDFLVVDPAAEESQAA